MTAAWPGLHCPEWLVGREEKSVTPSSTLIHLKEAKSTSKEGEGKGDRGAEREADELVLVELV